MFSTCLRPGFFKAVQLVLQLREDGVATAGVPCHSFVWMNSATAVPSRSKPFLAELLLG